jgi:hypothetical protein
MITYDPHANAITIDTSGVQSWGADVSASVVMYSSRLLISGLSFGLRVSVNDILTHNISFPPIGASYIAVSTPDGSAVTLETVRVRWRPEDAVILVAWVNGTGGLIERTATFTVARPAMPTDGSWTWNATTREWEQN